MIVDDTLFIKEFFWIVKIGEQLQKVAKRCRVDFDVLVVSCVRQSLAKITFNISAFDYDVSRSSRILVIRIPISARLISSCMGGHITTLHNRIVCQLTTTLLPNVG